MLESILKNIMLSVFFFIFRKPLYLALASTSTLLVFFLVLWVSNINLFQNTILDPHFSFSIKTKILVALIDNLSWLTITTTALLSILLGLNIAALTYYFKNKISVFRAAHATTGIFGILFGILGLGCAACGSFILMTLLPFFGLGALLSILPLHGGEFGIIGVILLTISLYKTIREISKPTVCQLV